MGKQNARNGRVEAGGNGTSNAAGNKDSAVDLNPNVLQQNLGHRGAKVNQGAILTDRTSAAGRDKGC